MADQAQLHRVAARRRPALLGQPHADHGFGEAAARPRPGAVASSSSTTCCCRPTTSSSRRRRYGCNLQMGGSDQWGNIVTGIDLGRRMGTHQLYALTCPLLTTASGAKMGKTAAGAVWLNEDQLRVYDYWQFWRNTEDGDVGALPQAVHARCRWPRSPSWRRCRARKSTRPRRCWRPKRPRCCTAARRPKPPPDGAGDVREGRDRPRACRPWRSRQRAGSGPRRAGGVREGGARQVQRRGAPADPGRRPARERCRGDATRTRS